MQVWFQNRRMKHKRTERDHEIPESGPLGNKSSLQQHQQTVAPLPHNCTTHPTDNVASSETTPGYYSQYFASVDMSQKHDWRTDAPEEKPMVWCFEGEEGDDSASTSYFSGTPASSRVMAGGGNQWQESFISDAVNES